MLLASPWKPWLHEGNQPPCERLAAALGKDILDGGLESGARLPAHRELAYNLGIGLGSVTKAYALLERRGLVRTAKGSGTFVATSQNRDRTMVDMSRNSPPAAMSERLLSRTLTAIARKVDASFFNGYPPTIGHEEHRRLITHWLTRRGIDVEPARLLLTSGAQHALSVAFNTACGVGGTIFAEAATYSGAIALAKHSGQRMIGLGIDDEGLIPDALDRALHAHDGTPAAVYVTPTMQSPTTSTMGRSRRDAIVAICRRHNTLIVEDDVYSLRPLPEHPQIANLAPERTLYANSLSKTLNPSLRIGGLIVPKHLMPRAVDVLHATSLTVSALSCAVMQQWVIDGTAETVEKIIQEEGARRQQLAQSILGPLMRTPGGIGYHIWLPMEMNAAEQLDGAARSMGILVTRPGSTNLSPLVNATGIRLCIGAPRAEEVAPALQTISGLIENIRKTSQTETSI
ncbi:aspartate aminotransferase [Ensifer sp. Root31]|uniref:aminotransferase-like domain-containing protein n=1 Tax=Ensifer sp. Root31 TaxID=1736512 RepID=UPI00070D2180|nr:PLP-dependent aminotransferase family protein [Ensifer sp. Root31]KQU86333.1 aspartate aminotransferase [Ensifer sp. Root31]